MDPAAAFLGLANIFFPLASCVLLSILKLFLLIKISPLTSMNSGYSFFNLWGISLIVLILFVTISPVVPSPLVTPFNNIPLWYDSEIDNPSILGSHINSNGILFFKDKNLLVLLIKSSISLMVNPFTKDPIGFL